MKAYLLTLLLATFGTAAYGATSFDESRAVNAFGLKSLQYALKETPSKNVVYSPVSAHLLLGMVLNGAKGQTAQEIGNVVEIPVADLAASNQTVLALLQDMNSRPEGELKLSLNNGMWIKPAFEPDPGFISVIKDTYLAEEAPLQSADQLNSWASAKTNGLIPKITTDDEVAQQVMILANATYFKAKWKFPFNPAYTSQFFPEGSGPVPAQLMSRSFFMPYMKTDDYSAVEIPYGEHEMASMILVLPTEGTKLQDFQPRMTVDWYNDLVAQLSQTPAVQDVSLTMPKTSFDIEFKMNDTLKAMGMPTVFSNLADLSGISQKAGLKLSYVKQNAAIRIDENGTEAAAVTTGGAGAASIRITVPFRADRPFVYFIRDKQSGVILFAGQVVKP